MSNLIIFSLIFLLVFITFFVTLKSFITQFYIRKRLKQGLKANKEQIRRVKDNRNLLFEVYKRVYNGAVYAPNKLLSKNRRHFEQKVNNELNRMIKNPFTMILSKLLSAFKGVSALVLLLVSLFFGSIVVDEYKASSLRLPTINPDIELNLSINIEDEIKKLFSDLFTINKLPSFDFPDMENEEIVPFYPSIDYPSRVTNAEQLGQAIASNMADFQNHFTIYYEGYGENLSRDLENAYTWLEHNEPYLWAVRGETSIQSMYYGSYITLQITMNYDLTADQNALVYGKIKQLAQTLDPDLTDVEKVKFVNDYLVTQTKYNAECEVNPHTPYAILLHGEGVCEGYALAAYLMLEELGIENKYVVGDAGGPHAWNLVKVENNWYHLDVTWNDPIPDQGKKIRYDYFLISDETISKDHSWDTATYPTSHVEDYLDRLH